MAEEGVVEAEMAVGGMETLLVARWVGLVDEQALLQGVWVARVVSVVRVTGESLEGFVGAAGTAAVETEGEARVVEARVKGATEDMSVMQEVRQVLLRPEHQAVMLALAAVEAAEWATVEVVKVGLAARVVEEWAVVVKVEEAMDGVGLMEATVVCR